MAKAGLKGLNGYPTDDLTALTAKVAEVTRRLTERYGSVPWSTKDPLSMLIEILLSHRTRDEQTAAAYDSLKRRYPTWASLRDAPVEDVEVAIAMVNWPETKAPRLQATLRRITEECGELNLDFLHNLSVEEGSAWLSRLDGVGPKTIACVLLFSCQKPILPVDTHVHRVSGRLGLIGSRVTADGAHPLLQALMPPDARSIYDFHKALLRHGQRVCVFSQPRCHRCAITDQCVYFQTVVRPRETPADPNA